MRNLFAKRIPFATTALLLMAFMFACSHDEPEQPEKPAGPEVPEWEEVVIDGDGELSAMAFCIGGDSVNVENGTQSGNEESMRASTAFDGQNYVLTLGDRITIELERSDGTKEGPKIYKVTNALTGALEFDDTGKPFYWENSSETVKLRAWSYGNSTAFSSEPVGNVFHLNANQQETTAGIDNYQELLYAPQWSCNYQDNKGKVEVNLYHQMARLTIRLKHEASENPSSTLTPLTIQQVTIGDGTLPNIAKFSETGIDIANNDFTGSWTDVKKETEATGVINPRVDDAEDAKYSAVLFPGTFAAGTKFISILTTDGQTFAYKIPTGNTLTLEAGKQYDYTINVNDFVQVSTLEVGDIADVVYNGNPHEPHPTVTYGTKTLVEGTHYTLSWSNNTNAGTAICTVTGLGIFAGTKDKTFTINRKVLTSTDLYFENTSITRDYIWQIGSGSNKLTKPADCTVTYTSSTTSVATVNSSTGVLAPGGTLNTNTTITATATGNYSGSASYTIKATSKERTFSYTQTIQTDYLCPSKYKLEVWGAQGGSKYATGGKGGYESGVWNPTTNQYVYVGVGGCPGTGTGGGYNGGAVARTGSAQVYKSAGGGGSHIAYGDTNRGVMSNYNEYRGELLVVAGGGGGGTQYSSAPTMAGGAGGGTTPGSVQHCNSTSIYGTVAGITTDQVGFGIGEGSGSGYQSGSRKEETGHVWSGMGATGYVKSGLESPTHTTGSRSGHGQAKITWISQ